MNTQNEESFFDYDAELTEILREFREGLSGRLEDLRAALDTLAHSFDSNAAERFYRAAHSLKGTAPSFGAHELVGHAAALAELGSRWQKALSTSADDLTAASKELDELRTAVEKYVGRCE